MKLIEVTDTKTAQDFLKLPKKMYAQDPNWVQPLDADIMAVFDPAKNPKFQHGECIRWLLVNEKEELIGRVAAFVDYKIANIEKQPTGGMGFFECINDQKAAFMLFDACKQWLQARGMEAMDGPVNFGQRNNWWGLLVDGFLPPVYNSNYHHPYYRALFEAYGFQDYFQQYTYRIEVKGEEQLDENFRARAKRILDAPAYRIEHIQKKHIDKYVEDFRAVYNQSWGKHEGVTELSTADTQKLLKELKPVIDDRLIWFAYYNDSPVAFMVMIPELNELFKHVNGKLNLIGKLKFGYGLWTGQCKTALGIVIGVLPRFQGRGVESAMIQKFSKFAFDPKFPYKTLIFNWTGDFLPAMMRVYESLGAEISRTHITYRKLFDENAVFERHPKIK
ncbi:hypothetical protein [Eisenibacter elegans]|jgi:GNAT superfamily N-acetyltransferase|uniref:hypothetical protein n=1 Tax=Eisenibacter elegans TaxID=997 RepID=UPI0003FAC227|nr:hypothetical protein [Eisenibacter elegans]